MRFKCILLFLIVAVLHPAFAQETQERQKKTPKQSRFSLGLNYSFLQSRMMLFSRTESGIWQGLDYGTDTLTTEDIESVNSISRFSGLSNTVCLEAGMVFLDNPGGHWHISGKVLLGIARTTYETYDKVKGTTDLKVTSSFSRPCLGLEFLFRYAFNPHWGLALTPYVAYSWGSTTHIEDNLDATPLNLTINRKETSGSVYSHMAVMACYTIGNFTVSAGPGCYILFNQRTYTIDRTNPQTGSSFFNETKSVYLNKSVIDCSINLDWRIIPQLDLNLYCGIGEDILVHPGLRFLF